ncbi:MAG: hypothetical protein COU32_02870 [Candidatus Magasanikbacteria bacterium CG10_big_fil_rev_8_21_14_0_10_42_10]|uniref:Uncharacterized protein n=2 Tax=Candidatus Magasanikiibacteriota TaxID=1752731 RepID=A0A2H0TY53_9BACT|nr:MAG: hypothetical protein COU32_02870 [Candidatus Magasanikbacteria bacterium CG10_big_fil_rev_8_21_14_0_10_42_10]PIZ94410.1 MAG: hypothetical protein COX82_00695 [Candidatus Magasanikbacteria bacterium CG_4_10_14_0_2_um_filter_41_10]
MWGVFELHRRPAWLRGGGVGRGSIGLLHLGQEDAFLDEPHPSCFSLHLHAGLEEDIPVLRIAGLGCYLRAVVDVVLRLRHAHLAGERHLQLQDARLEAVGLGHLRELLVRPVPEAGLVVSAVATVAIVADDAAIHVAPPGRTGLGLTELRVKVSPFFVAEDVADRRWRLVDADEARPRHLRRLGGAGAGEGGHEEHQDDRGDDAGHHVLVLLVSRKAQRSRIVP